MLASVWLVAGTEALSLVHGLRPLPLLLWWLAPLVPLAVVATSLSIVAVFLPVGLMPGISGQFYRQFALTIAFSVAISGFNSLTLSPALCAILLPFICAVIATRHRMAVLGAVYVVLTLLMVFPAAYMLRG